MKTLKNTYRWLMILLFVSSCGNEEVPYDHFNATDLQFVPTIYENEGQTFTFENTDGEQIELAVKSYHVYEKSSGGFGSNGVPFRKYQELEIILSYEGSCHTNSMFIINIAKTESGMITWILPMLDTPSACFGGTVERYDFPYPLTTITIEGESYDKILILEPDNPFKFDTNHIIDRAYFDFKQGFVGFEDTSNNVFFKLTP